MPKVKKIHARFKLYRNKKTGRRYFKLKKKRVYLAKGLSERELIKFILTKLLPRRRKRLAREATIKRSTPSREPVTQASIAQAQTINKQEEQVRNLEQRVQQEIRKAIEPKKAESSKEVVIRRDEQQPADIRYQKVYNEQTKQYENVPYTAQSVKHFNKIAQAIAQQGISIGKQQGDQKARLAQLQADEAERNRVIANEQARHEGRKLSHMERLKENEALRAKQKLLKQQNLAKQKLADQQLGSLASRKKDLIRAKELELTALPLDKVFNHAKMLNLRKRYVPKLEPHTSQNIATAIRQKYPKKYPTELQQEIRDRAVTATKAGIKEIEAEEHARSKKLSEEFEKEIADEKEALASANKASIGHPSPPKSARVVHRGPIIEEVEDQPAPSQPQIQRASEAPKTPSKGFISEKLAEIAQRKESAKKEAPKAESDRNSLEFRLQHLERIYKKSELRKLGEKYKITKSVHEQAPGSKFAKTKQVTPETADEVIEAIKELDPLLPKGLIKDILERDISGVKFPKVEDEKSGSGSSHIGISNFDIDKIMKRYPEYLGTIASDEIPSLIPKVKPHSRGAFVMNLDKHNQKGSHWVAIFYDARPHGSMSIDYFDPLADPPTKSFMKDMKALSNKLNADTYLKFKQNHIKKQSDRSDNCGYFSTEFLINRFRNRPFSACSGYDDHVKGERDIEAFKKRLNIKPFQYIGKPNKQEPKQDGGLLELRTHASPSVRSFLQTHGNKKVIRVIVGRTPIVSAVQKVVNWLPAQFRNSPKLQYDKFFHLYLIVTLEDGHTYRMEKEHVVVIRPYSSVPAQEQRMTAGSPNVPLDTFWSRGEKSAPSPQSYYVYESVTQNCQYYCKWMLRGNGLLNSGLEKFIMQDVQHALDKYGIFRRIAKVATDTANRIDTFVNGKGKLKSKSKVYVNH